MRGKKGLPVHVDLGDVSGLSKRSIALVEQLQVINKKNLKTKVAELPQSILVKIGEAMRIQYPFPYEEENTSKDKEQV